MTDLGLIVRRRREELGWSILDVSAASEASRYFVADLEKGKPSCQFDKVMAVLGALQLLVEIRAGAPKPGSRPVRTVGSEKRRPLSAGPAIAVDRLYDDPETIGCLECGRQVRNLQRHLSSAHSMRSTEYRRRWRLPEGFDMRPRAISEAETVRRQVKVILKRDGLRGAAED